MKASTMPATSLSAAFADDDPQARLKNSCRALALWLAENYRQHPEFRKAVDRMIAHHDDERKAA